MYNFKNKLSPFYIWCNNNFPFLDDYFDSLTIWEILQKLGKQSIELNKAVIEIQKYLENLDLQDEVNNKLDEMAEDGTLDSIIGRYITNKIERTFKNDDDLKNDLSLENLMLVETLGKYVENDGGGSVYKITNIEPSPISNITNNNKLDNFYIKLNNGLFAVPINNINNDYYNEVSVVTERHFDTDCYFTEIPLNDNNNNEIELYVKNNSGMEISDYARLHKTTLSINATLAVENPVTHIFENASVISNGEIIREYFNPPTFLNDNYKFIGIKENREFVDFQANITTAEQMIAQGVKEAWLCFGKLVENGVITDYCNSDDEIMVNSYPRQAIGIKTDKTVVILTTDGRTPHDKGLTGVETAQLLISKGCINVYNLDGGGSTNTVYKGSRINKYIDNQGLDERHIVYCLNVKKPTSNVNIDETMNNIGIEKERIIKQLLPIIPRVLVKNPANLNELKNELMIYSCFNSTNKPTDADNYGYLLNIPIASENNSLFGESCRQFYFSRTNNKYWRRTLTYGTWSEWIQCDTRFAGELTAVNDQSLGIASNYPVMTLNNSIANYYPNTLVVEDNKIKSNVNCACKITATFFIDCQLDGLITIRLRKNGTTNIAAAAINCEAGKRYEIVLQKMQTLNINDYLEFTTNGGTNTGGVNKIVSNNINIEQNII